MSAATPDRDIPLREIPSELRNLRDEAERWRAKWAQDTTELRRQVRDLSATVGSVANARDAARKTCDDLTTHCTSQGDHIQRLAFEAESMRIERDDQRALVVKLSSLNEKLRADYESLRKQAEALAAKQRPLEERIRDLECGLHGKDRVIKMLEDADGSGLLRARRQRDAYREQLCEILKGDAGEDCLECLGEGCGECIDGRVAR